MTRKYLVTLMFAAGGVLLSSAAAQAVTLVSYTELGNSGTKEITTTNPLQITVNNIASPYGSPTIAQVGSDWTLTFTPASTFRADATGTSTSGMSTDLAAKLDFRVIFSAPVNLTATITEGGTKATTGTGTVNVFAGGVITEADHAAPLETISGTIANNFGLSSWTAMGQLSGFQNSYSAFQFSIDNDLFADAPAGPGGGSASIIKNTFVITIHTPPGSGGNPGVPEPASLTMLGLAVAGLLCRARRWVA